MSHKEAIILPSTDGRGSRGLWSLLPNYRFSDSHDESVNHEMF